MGIGVQGHRVRGSSERHIERNKKMEDQQIEGRRLCTRNYGIVVTHGQKVSVKSGLALELQVHKAVLLLSSKAYAYEFGQFPSVVFVVHVPSIKQGQQRCDGSTGSQNSPVGSRRIRHDQ